MKFWDINKAVLIVAALVKSITQIIQKLEAINSTQNSTTFDIFERNDEILDY